MVENTEIQLTLNLIKKPTAMAKGEEKKERKGKEKKRKKKVYVKYKKLLLAERRRE